MEIDDIIIFFEISIQTYFKTSVGNMYCQRDGLPIGKSFLEPLAGIYVHWIEKNFVYNKYNSLRYHLKIWKRQVDDVFFVQKGTKKVLEFFVR